MTAKLSLLFSQCRTVRSHVRKQAIDKRFVDEHAGDVLFQALKIRKSQLRQNKSSRSSLARRDLRREKGLANRRHYLQAVDERASEHCRAALGWFAARIGVAYQQ